MARVGLIGKNTVEYIEKLLDIWNCGDSAILIDCDTPPTVICQMLAEYKAKFCYIEETLCHELADSISFEVKSFSIFQTK